MNNEKINKKILLYTLLAYILYNIFHNFSNILKKLSDLHIKPFNQIISDLFNPGFWFALLTGNLDFYNPKKNGTLTVGDVTLLETESYTNYAVNAKYFKISEYMKNNSVPEVFRGNLDLLYYNLDKIREQWGSSIVIVTGYDSQPFTDVENTNCYQRCLCVRIMPKIGTSILLTNLITSLRDAKKIMNCEIIHHPNQYIYLSFTKP